MTVLTMENIVRGIEPRKIKDGTQTVYDVVDADGVKWTAWERELAERAFALKDQTSLWKVSQEQNGKWVNRNLKDIVSKPTDGFAPALKTMEAALGSNDAITHSWTPGSNDDVVVAAKSLVQDPSYTDRTIFRQVAAKVAIQLVTPGGSAPLDFWSNVEDLARYFETGVTPVGANAFPQDPGPQDFPPQTDDDIPF